jgi:glucose/arabinose dehydrogenase
LCCSIPWSEPGAPLRKTILAQALASGLEHITKLIKLGQFTAFPHALRFVLNVTTVGIRVAAASSSKNADLLLQQVRLDTFAEHHLDSPLGVARRGDEMVLRSAGADLVVRTGVPQR